MIKCNVTICGTVSRTAQIRTNKDGKNFLAMSVSVVIPAQMGINKTVEVSVAKDGGTQEECNSFMMCTRVVVVGTLTFHKKGDALFLNMSATGINAFSVPAEDSIKGDMEFRGTLGNKIESKTDKKGNPFCIFSAFSSEKSGQDASGAPTYDFTWVRFMHFGSAQQDWMQPKTGIDAKGELQLGVFKDRLDITCRVSELSKWEKQPFNPNN